MLKKNCLMFGQTFKSFLNIAGVAPECLKKLLNVWPKGPIGDPYLFFLFALFLFQSRRRAVLLRPTSGCRSTFATTPAKHLKVFFNIVGVAPKCLKKLLNVWPNIRQTLKTNLNPWGAGFCSAGRGVARGPRILYPRCRARA